MAKCRLEKILSGVAGEYFVAGELSRRGYLASITLRNTRDIDILASSADASRSAAIQVKTNQGGKPIWVLSKKAEQVSDPGLFYVFVNLNGVDEKPSFHIVPSAVVAGYCRRGHRKWLSIAKRDGKPRKDTAMRKFSDEKGAYLNAWHLLELG